MKILSVSNNYKRQGPDLRKNDPDEMVMMVDVDRCISCGACQLACQIENGDSKAGPGHFRPIRIQLGNKGTRTLNLPLSCRHCDLPCEYYNEYNFWTTCPSTKVFNTKIVSCDFCAERLKKGFMPACATRCTMKCIYFGRAEDVGFAFGEKKLREMGDVELTGKENP